MTSGPSVHLPFLGISHQVHFRHNSRKVYIRDIFRKSPYFRNVGLKSFLVPLIITFVTILCTMAWLVTNEVFAFEPLSMTTFGVLVRALTKFLTKMLPLLVLIVVLHHICLGLYSLIPHSFLRSTIVLLNP
jgi:hypothetical protein